MRYYGRKISKAEDKSNKSYPKGNAEKTEKEMNRVLVSYMLKT